MKSERLDREVLYTIVWFYFKSFYFKHDHAFDLLVAQEFLADDLLIEIGKA